MTGELAGAVGRGWRPGSLASACSVSARVRVSRPASIDRFLATVKIHARCPSSGLPVSWSSYCRAPFGGADVAGMRGEEPVVTIKVAGAVLSFAVGGFVEVFHDHHAG